MSLWRELSRGSASTSHKILRAGTNGGSLAAKAIYDDVYGGPPEFVSHSFFPRPEDYSEIFGSFYVSRASLIPVLDLPPPDETDVFFDVRSSSFDYAEVFGVLDYQDFAVTYEELSKQSNERNVHSPVETRTPAENESLSDNSVDSTKTKCIFNGDSNMSCEFSESYHRAYQSRKEDMSNGITQVTQISEVPEVTYLVDRTSSPDRDDEIQPLHVNDDEYFNIDLSMGHIEGKQTKKTKPQPPNAVYERQNFDNDPQTPKGSNKSISHLNRSFITISEVSLRTKASQVPPPSQPPPIIGEKKSHHHRLDSDCNHVFSKGISNDSSPPYFDVEVDASSSAAPSAELLSAKEMIERKKKGVDTFTKSHLRYDTEEKEGSVRTLLDQSNNDDNEIRFSVMDKTKIIIETAEGNQVSLRGEKLPVVDKYAEKKLKNYIDYPRERKGAAGFFEVKLDHSRKTSELVKNGDIMIHLSERNVKTEEDIVIEAREEVEDKDSSKMGVKEAAEHVNIEVTIDKVGYECQRMFEDLDLGELVKLNGMHVGTESFQKTKKTNLAERFQVQTDMGLNKIRTEASKLDNGYKAMKQHCKRDQSIEKVEETQKCLGYKESGDRISECKINNTQLDDARMMHLDINDNVNAVYRGKEEFKHLECQVRTENINESHSIDDNGSITEVNISSETKYCNREADKDIPMVSNLKPSSIGCELKLLGDTLIISKEAKSPVLEEGENQLKEVGTSTGHQHYVRVKNTSTTVSCRQCQDSKYDQERGEQGKALNLELTKNKFVPGEVDKERIEEGSKCETNAKPTSERKVNNPDLASEVNAARSTARRDGEKNIVRVKREQELENDHHKKMEEEREREREREKDRMIVDRTTLEGRNHAEKAAMERAIADAQQRAMLEARERLEKACEEAREKSLTGKAVLEARVRAERAVVKRTNAEARERAFENAVAEKSVFESRIERSFSDRLSASSRNTGIRQSSSFSNTAVFRTQSTLESSGSRYTHSSSNGERKEDIKGESAQRCKARLERHRRIAERAANALAEKNMRDLLAQREQVEISRLAETLDADVRRWSSGKEGNLRALLSTLQYILLPDSGWLPIPLTQVITTAAVKKAYRKATLCVHPDKLQQRGASIQQKYICEKVYDLLKEAWNKFCSEER